MPFSQFSVRTEGRIDPFNHADSTGHTISNDHVTSAYYTTYNDCPFQRVYCYKGYKKDTLLNYNSNCIRYTYRGNGCYRSSRSQRAQQPL